MTLTEFLEARIAEDEATARNAGNSPVIEVARRYGKVAAQHFYARWDPARVLAECEAKRAIIEAHPIEYSKVSDYTDCVACLDVDTYDAYPCLTMRALGYVYAGHPDYRQEWRP